MQNGELHLKYVILDDDEIDRLAVETEARKFSFLQKTATCSHPLEAIEIINRFNPDIIFLDIEMPDVTGIELLRKKIFSATLPVFITSHPEFALEGFELEAFDYLLKPFSADRFSKCALRLNDFFRLRAKAFAFDNETNNDFIVIKQGYDKYKIAIHDILYLEAMKDYTKIATVDKKYLVLTTLNGLSKKLPRDIFVQVHRSYIVNKTKVDSIQKNKIIIQSEELPVGKLYKHALSF